jgi:hypothetical protein
MFAGEYGSPGDTHVEPFFVSYTLYPSDASYTVFGIPEGA